jgi:hypothetical protein
MDSLETYDPSLGYTINAYEIQINKISSPDNNFGKGILTLIAIIVY